MIGMRNLCVAGVSRLIIRPVTLVIGRVYIESGSE